MMIRAGQKNSGIAYYDVETANDIGQQQVIDLSNWFDPALDCDKTAVRFGWQPHRIQKF